VNVGVGDPHDLQRFVDAQAPVYADVRDELARGAKRSHWMWFVFPQLRGLGGSPMAQRYGLASKDEAAAYWAHPLLGARLAECTRLMLSHPSLSALQILGPPDDLKFGSSMTLFEVAVPQEPLFGQAIERFFGGVRDLRTLSRL
jgi:uncharacterized protein (DUF1810 family)